MHYCALVVELWRESSNCISLRCERRKFFVRLPSREAYYTTTSERARVSSSRLIFPQAKNSAMRSSVLEDVSEVCSLLLHLWSHGCSSTPALRQNLATLGKKEGDGLWNKANGVNGVNGLEHRDSALLNGVKHIEEFSPLPHPLEQTDIDQPVHCPAPEPCIVHDGKVWKQRVVAIARRRAENARAMAVTDHIEYYSSTQHRRRRSRSRESSQLPSLTAPELIALK
ncbi:unnamed protein product [Sphagnum troendelagicum]|uniref:Uncharacterized protein n=1 Tax=Sphagnum troendelagicum TaxID=128251 RepID=A0ABP0T949_9BRYO